MQNSERPPPADIVKGNVQFLLYRPILALPKRREIKMTAPILRIVIVLFAVAGLVATANSASLITDFDSTQPRGFGGATDIYHPNGCAYGPVYNAKGQDLCPIKDGIWSPQYHASRGGQDDEFKEWKGMMMGNAARDPAFFATLSVANSDFLNLLYATAGKGWDTYNVDLYNLVGIQTARQVVCALKLWDISQQTYAQACTAGGDAPALMPEDKLPVTADLCLRCHFTAGWLEGRSEPQSPHFPYLKGQFWGAKFQEYPGWPGAPVKVDISKDSESDMQGIQCGFCHRAKDNFKRSSKYNNSTIANGSGGYFVARYTPFDYAKAEPEFDFQDEGVFCGTCHDVTNPLIYTKTSQSPSKMLHPIERTYSEWYWSGKRSTKCQDCHKPMEFQGAQTWLLYPGLDKVWGAVDKVWLSSPYNYTSNVTAYRTEAYKAARYRSETLMRSAARLEIVSATASGGNATVKVKITNNAGHKLPTGFAEGRQMWVLLTAKDPKGNIIFQDGVIDQTGALLRTAKTKVYEQVVLAKGYEPFTISGYSILDADQDGTVSHYEKEFHFVLMNYIEKDNRIPPKGFNKAAYMADGAFIVPFDAKDTDYPSGQNWDITTYTFPTSMVPKGGTIYLTAELKYQTFNKEYIDFLYEMDTELTEADGGMARNFPCNDGSVYCGLTNTWGDLLKQVWTGAGNGQPVSMYKASKSFRSY